MTNPMDITHAFGWDLDKGKLRSRNEDSLGAAKIKLVSEEAQQSVGLYMVADGIGGMAGGAEASKTAIQTAMHEVIAHIHHHDTAEDIAKWLKSAMETAHKVILQNKSGKQGTTLVIAAVIEDTVHIVNVGDSRAYVIHDGKLRQITVDHTLAQAFVDQGIIPAEEAFDHPMRNVLSHAVGVDEKFDSDSYTETVSAGDYLLLCSDGLHGYTSSEDILKTVLTSENPQSASEKLTELANDGGGKDNIAVIVVRIHERE